MPISVLPNAGLPSVVDGKMHYDLTAEEFVKHHLRFVTEFGVQVVGGCCGTTPEYIRQLAEAVKGLTPAERHPVHEDGAASIYSFQPFSEEGSGAATSFIMIGERTNANGSKKFRESLLDGELGHVRADGQGPGQGRAATSSTVCVDYVGRDGTLDMDEVAQRFATQSSVPLVLDSTEPQVLEAGLQWLGGRAILNSANLEDGFAEGSRMDRVFKLAKTYGAAVICLLIDEEGQAPRCRVEDAGRSRIHDIAIVDLRAVLRRPHLRRADVSPVDRRRRPPQGRDGDHRCHSPHQGRVARHVHHARSVERELRAQPRGASRLELGVQPRMHRSRPRLGDRARGEDHAAVEDPRRAARRVPRPDLRPPGHRGILSNGDEKYDPLTTLLDVFADVKAIETVKEDRSGWPIEQRLSQRIIDGDRENLTADLDEAMANGFTALDIVNNVLLEGMKTVGELFRLGPDAAAIRAAVGRDDEDVRGLPRALHGEGRGATPARVASCWRRSRATCTTSARTSSTSSSPTTATRCTTSVSRSRSPR